MTEHSIDQKRCPECKEVKPLTEFHRHKNRSDGRSRECAKCRNAWGREHHIPTALSTEEKRALSAYQSMRYAELKRLGICVECKIVPARQGKIHCGPCAKALVQKQAVLRDRAVKRGVCCVCWSRPAMPTRIGQRGARCDQCYVKSCCHRNLGSNQHWKEMLQKLEDQDYRCAYSGEPILLGLNDSMDHTFPVKRFPALRSDINNVKWVTRQVNTMKAGYTAEEFLDSIRRILTVAG